MPDDPTLHEVAIPPAPTEAPRHPLDIYLPSRDEWLRTLAQLEEARADVATGNRLLDEARQDRDRANSALAALNGFLDPTRARVIELEALLAAEHADKLAVLAVSYRRWHAYHAMRDRARWLLCAAQQWRNAYESFIAHE